MVMAHPMGQRRGYPRPMIDLGTLAGLHRLQHRLAAYWLYCDRWAVLDPAALINAGDGQRLLAVTALCERRIEIVLPTRR